MKKRTHFFLSKSLDIPSRYKFWVCFGSISPDLTFMCLVKPHQFKFRINDVLKLYSSLDFNNKDWLFYYRVGVISHFVADFFTSPHNRKGVKGFCTMHRGYELDLDRFFKVNFKYYKFSSIDYIDFKNYLYSLHKEYMSKDFTLRNDFSYICEVVGLIYNKALI